MPLRNSSAKVTPDPVREALPMLDGALTSALNALQASGAFEDRNVSVISIEPIRTRFGERWPRKSEQIWLHVRQFLQRQFRSEDLILQLDDAQILVAQPGRPAAFAQMQCVRATLDLMRFFLGEVEPPHVRVNIVDAYEDDLLVCTPVDPGVVRSILNVHDAAKWRPKVRGRAPILTPLGRELSAELTLQPILALQSSATPVGHLVRTVLTDARTGEAIDRNERHQLQPRDVACADLKVLSEALRLRATLPGSPGAIIVPVSYLTLACSATRYELLEAVRKLPPVERQGFAFEIVDLEPGVPMSRLEELVSTARRQCRGVVCRMDPTVMNAEKLKQVGATLSVLPDRPSTLTEYAMLKMEGLVSEILKRVPAMMLHQSPPEVLSAASLVGVTHCTVAEPAPASAAA